MQRLNVTSKATSFVNLRQLVPFFNPAVQDWAIDARLLRWLTFLWLFIGLVVLFSASYPSGDAEYGDGLYYFKRQIISVMLGLLVFNVVVNFPLRHVLGIANWGVILLLGVIFVTLIPGVGTTTNGATRWIACGAVSAATF
jgi:cell division protein FtsW